MTSHIFDLSSLTGCQRSISIDTNCHTRQCPMCWSLYHTSPVSRIKDRIVLWTDELMSSWIVTHRHSLVSTGMLISHKAATRAAYQYPRTPTNRFNESIGRSNRRGG